MPVDSRDIYRTIACRVAIREATNIPTGCITPQHSPDSSTSQFHQNQHHNIHAKASKLEIEYILKILQGSWHGSPVLLLSRQDLCHFRWRRTADGRKQKRHVDHLRIQYPKDTSPENYRTWPLICLTPRIHSQLLLMQVNQLCPHFPVLDKNQWSPSHPLVSAVQERPPDRFGV